MGNAEALKYFLMRPRESQLAAWASAQSRPLSSRALLEDEFAWLKQKFADGRIPSPTFWGGYRVVPDAFEVNVNYRFAPGKSVDAAKADVTALVSGRCSIEFTDLAPSGRVCAGNPHFEKLVALTGRQAEAKQARRGIWEKPGGQQDPAAWRRLNPR